MADPTFTTEDKRRLDLLFKRSFGVAATSTDVQPGDEIVPGRPQVFASQVYTTKVKKGRILETGEKTKDAYSVIGKKDTDTVDNDGNVPGARFVMCERLTGVDYDHDTQHAGAC